MAKAPPLSDHHCTPTQCETCSSRDASPLCSVSGAHDMVQRERSEVRFKAGQTIFYQGNSPLGLYVIQKGVVKLQYLDAEGNSNTLRLLGSSQALGYRALFAGEPYQASAICVEDCTMCFLPKTILLNVIKDFPDVAMNILHQLSKDLRTAEDKWITQVNKGAPERVAEALLFLDEHFHHQPWTRREIAQWAGTTPETVMRSLSQFEKEGLVESSGRTYKIVDGDKLFKKTSST